MGSSIAVSNTMKFTDVRTGTTVTSLTVKLCGCHVDPSIANPTAPSIDTIE